MNNIALDALYNIATNDLLLVAAKARSGEEAIYKTEDIASAILLRLPSMSLNELFQTFFVTRGFEKEFFDHENIFIELRKKSGKQFNDDIDTWMSWYFGKSVFTPEDFEQDILILDKEKLGLRIIYNLYKAEHKALKKLGKLPDEK